MAFMINCADGVVVRGETREELLSNAEAHLRDAHPEMVGNVSRDDLLAQATEA